MGLALEQARLARDGGDVPVGAVALHEGRILASAGNRREADHDPTAHAEVLCLRAAAEALGRWRLDDVTLYVTLEPCVMCAGAILNARLGRLVIGAMDEKAGAVGSRYNVLSDPRLNHEVPVSIGLAANASSELLTSFFEARRSTTSDEDRRR